MRGDPGRVRLVTPTTASWLLAALDGAGVTHVTGLPDSNLAALLDLVADHPTIRWVPVTREGEAFAVASGVWLGGGTPFVAVQSTGLFEAGDALRGTAQRMGVPLVVLVSYRGWTTHPHPGTAHPPDPDHLVRADVDSAALWLEPTLSAWGVPYAFVGQDADGSVDPDRDARRVADAFASAERDRRPVALLLNRRLV